VGHSDVRRVKAWGSLAARSSPDRPLVQFRSCVPALKHHRLEQRPRLDARLALARLNCDTGLPEFSLRDGSLLAHCDVLAVFELEISGPLATCAGATDLFTKFKEGLNDPTRPLRVLLFCGPTGVGQTELAKTLARYLFGSGEARERLVRLDMSEYAAPGSGGRLVTRPDGQPSELIKRLRAQPFGVVLFDEIEKAAPDVSDVLLGVLDEGRLTDRFGRTATFRSAVIIMTSNLGTEHRGTIGFDASGAAMPHESVGRPYERAVTSFFRAEFFNRIDAVVTFQPLGAATIQAITRKELSDLAARERLAERGLKLRWSDALVAHLAQAGFDARYGARPLQRTLERLVVAPLSQWLIANPRINNADVTLALGDATEIVVSSE
jgi:ATP-dependent Clp protease ATP-binding subunit ClpC